MMHITEDTPPDMLAGAMDLIVHLPSNKSVKMSVERSTPMMDLLVQITSAHQLQLSNHILQALEMAPSSEKSDTLLPYKPNTPIGALDTQHIKVIAKNRPIIIPKNVPPGYQPFESTFRLQVHLPRNQLYVIRVSQHVLLEDVLKRVCEEKNLDIRKYELRHPGNLDEVLDLKLTLSDYKITEIYVVTKGTIGLAQTFSSNDIMALRKEEERKQTHAKTGGGVFNLIFKKVKSSTGSGSLSSENRSISPVHSDDSRSVTPPAVPPLPKERTLPSERPKPPQRKRRPAPKPPQKSENQVSEVSKPSSQISTNSDSSTILELQSKSVDTCLTICHSRNSSDSSGYHESSVLSENCNNTSLPRRPKSRLIIDTGKEKSEKKEPTSGALGNLSKMAGHSKSLSSLVAGRKKRAAPPPPTVASATSTTNLDKPSPEPATSPVLEVERPAVTTASIINIERSGSVVSNSKVDTKRPAPIVATATHTQKPDPLLASPPVEKTESGSPFYNTQTSLGSIGSTRSSQTSSVLPSTLTVDTTKPPNNTEETERISNNMAFVQNIEGKTEINLHHEKQVLDEPKDYIKSQQPIDTSYISEKERDKGLKSKEEQVEKESKVIELKEEDQLVNKLEENFPKVNHYDQDMSIDNDRLGNTAAYQKQEEKPIIVDYTEVEKNEPLQPPDKFLFPDSTEDQNMVEIDNHSVNELDINWQYQLPPPPSAFRDDCTSIVANATNCNTITSDSFETTDSIVTQAELFEARNTRNNDERSEINSVKSEDERSIYNKLSLENLEKRKSLVYNRELTTSLKLTCDDNYNDMHSQKVVNQSSSVVNEFDEPFKNNKIHESNTSSSANSTSSQSYLKKPIYDNTLPNFKITTYDNPKKKINIFEDDSVRSNADNAKRTFSVEGSQSENKSNKVNNHNTSEVISMQNYESTTKYQQKYDKGESYQYKKNEPLKFITRSESFSTNVNNMEYLKKSGNPVKRSKSQVALNKYKEQDLDREDGYLSKTNSLYDVSGLHSLEVMREIQNKLNLTNEHSNKTDTNHCSVEETETTQKEIQTQTVEKSTSQTQSQAAIVENPVKTYTYQGPPSICLGTWSERPKTQVSLKEDTDYRVNNKNIINSIKSNLSNIESSKTSTYNLNTQPSYVNNNYTFKVQKHSYFGSNETQQKTSNGIATVPRQKPTDIISNFEEKSNKERFGKNVSNTFINYNAATTYRKPLGNVNEKTPRPHSIALDSNFDVSRVPIVRAVELKKDIHMTSNFAVNNFNPITKDVYKSNDDVFNSKYTSEKNFENGSTDHNSMEDKYADIYQSSESLNELNSLKSKRNSFTSKSIHTLPKPAGSLNSFMQMRQTPVVMGFRTNETRDNSKSSHAEPKLYNKINTNTSSLEIKPRAKDISVKSNTGSNRHTIFGDIVLRKTSYLKTNDIANSNLRSEGCKDEKDFAIPAAPRLPEFTNRTKNASVSNNNDSTARSELLDAIRNFGGKKNLRHVRN